LSGPPALLLRGYVRFDGPAGSDRRSTPRERIASWPALRQLTGADWLGLAATALAPGRERVPAVRLAALGAAGLLAGGAAATRFGVFRAGPASVADPTYVIAAQRPGQASAG